MAKHEYRESDKHKPEPTDMTGTLKTTAGGGAQYDLSQVSPMLAEDRKATAERILDGDGKVLYQGDDEAPSAEDQQAALEEKAQKVLDNDGLTEQEKANQEGDTSKSDDKTTTDKPAKKAASKK